MTSCSLVVGVVVPLCCNCKILHCTNIIGCA